MATKDYSSKQEKMISDVLDWDCVVASGARACHPGDVIDDNWLGECKTHVVSGKRIKFSYKELSKICEEATSKFRMPILFVDDGSQKESNTWCMVNTKTAPFDYPVKSRTVSRSSLFLDDKLIESCDATPSHILRFEFNGDDVLVMRLSTFKDLC